MKNEILIDDKCEDEIEEFYRCENDDEDDDEDEDDNEELEVRMMMMIGKGSSGRRH